VNELEILTTLPQDLEVWLLLGYAVLVLAGARVTESLAQTHFRRARRSAEHGFEYDADADHYHCPHGERLSLHVINSEERLAVYRAPASTCAGCQARQAAPRMMRAGTFIVRCRSGPKRMWAASINGFPC
jgi:hypothetical protein